MARRHEVVTKMIFLVEIHSALDVATFILVRKATVDNGVALDRLSVLALQKIRHLTRQGSIVHDRKMFSGIDIQSQAEPSSSHLQRPNDTGDACHPTPFESLAESQGHCCQDHS